MFYALYEEYRQASGAGSWEDWLAQRPPKLPAFPFDETETGNDDVFRSQVMPGLVVCADFAGRVVIQADRTRHGWRLLVPDPALLVVAIETSRDVGSGPPSQGSPMQAAITGMTEVANALEEAARLNVRKQMLALLASTATLRNLVADLSYGRLPQEWMERPVSNATMCPVCFMYARKLTDGSAVLRHRPACPGKD